MHINLCRCISGYYGNPVLGSGEQCRPCPCPDGPNSGRHFASSCHQDNRNRQVVCNCNQGYTGKHSSINTPAHEFPSVSKIINGLIIREVSGKTAGDSSRIGCGLGRQIRQGLFLLITPGELKRTPPGPLSPIGW